MRQSDHDTQRQYSDFAERNLDVASRFGNEVMARCVFHDDSRASLQFNVAKGLFVCFSCGARGSIKKLETQLGLSHGQMTQEADVADIRRRLDLLDATKTRSEVIYLPESTLDQFTYPTDYWTHRGFLPETVEAFDLGYDPLTNAGTIPIRDMDGLLLGVIRRYLDEDADPRYKYPFQFKRRMNLFGAWLVAIDNECDTVILTEGSLDAIKVWQAGYAACAVYGNFLSTAQIRVLRRLGITNVVLMHDNDRGGEDLRDMALGYHNQRNRRNRIVEQEYVRETDLRYSFHVSEVRWPRTGPKDPAACSDELICHLVDSARTVL